MSYAYDLIDIDYYFGTSQPKTITYTNKGLLHNYKHPAYIEFYESGNVKREAYYYNDKLHRSGNNPAIIDYHDDPKKIIKKQIFYKHGLIHNSNGYALRLFDRYGFLLYAETWINNEFIDKIRF